LKISQKSPILDYNQNSKKKVIKHRPKKVNWKKSYKFWKDN